MSKLSKAFLYISAVLFLSACSDDDNGTTEVGQGTVSFNCDTQNSVEQFVTRAVSDYTIPASLVPDVDLFKLNITGTYFDKEQNQNVSYDSVFATLMEYHQDVPYLVSGNYTATFTYGDVTVENDTNACFSGSVDFTIVARKSISKDVKVKLSNSAIRLKTTPEFDNYFKDATFQVTTANGSTFDFTPNDGKVYFIEAGSNITLSGTAQKKHNDAEVSFSAETIGSTKPTTISTILIDSEATGGIELDITLDDITTTVPLEDQELNPNA